MMERGSCHRIRKTGKVEFMARMAITMGDASGVGPEILLRKSAAGELGDDVIVYGDDAILRAGAKLLGLNVDIHTLATATDAVPGKLNVVDQAMLSADDLTPGKLNHRAGRAARDYVERATLDALAGTVAGVVTLPMNKEATQASDPGFVGHTEFIAGLCGTDNFSMMLTTREVAVTHVSTHVSLRRAIELVTPERVLDVINLTHDALAGFIDNPRIAVCGLNPHAGEHGLFGDEDAQVIKPVIETAVNEGKRVSGPFPADTVFYQAIHNDQYDGIICMYHDQGHAPMKLVGFESAVNVTIGLPIVRTSVDHGTAFDIAWQGKAFTSSLAHALEYAWKLVGRVKQK
jgi:4-phospho-D-threonate 3-dehydrogenase / 4-phospho-D-erythronate 3-dehydrogenase